MGNDEGRRMNDEWELVQFSLREEKECRTKREYGAIEVFNWGWLIRDC